VNPEPKTVFITGASSGLGRALSLWFARRGARVWAAARRAEQLASLKAEVEAAGGPGVIEPVILDVTDSGAVRRALQSADDTIPSGLEVVVANAGVGSEMRPKRDSWPELERMLEVNVRGAAATLLALAPRMAERGRGQLVGISSIAAWVVVPRTGTYSATKAFLEVFCDGLRIDLQPFGVQVTCIFPGFVKSEITAKNRYPMPFLLETDDAADRIGRAILRRQKRFAFPWPMALAGRTARLFPKGVVARLQRR
jgi:short-subunit dehydrogenase